MTDPVDDDDQSFIDELREAAIEAEFDTGEQEDTVEEARANVVLRVARMTLGFIVVILGIIALPPAGTGMADHRRRSHDPVARRRVGRPAPALHPEAGARGSRGRQDPPFFAGHHGRDQPGRGRILAVVDVRTMSADDITAHRDAIDTALTTTRSVRRRLDFDRPVPAQVLLDCIDVAEQAPTGAGQSSRRWIIVRDQATKAKLAEAYREAGGSWMMETADRLEGTGHRLERSMTSSAYLAANLERAPALVIPTIIGEHDGSGRPGLFDSVIQSGWSFHIALRARGLGTTWTTMHLGKAAEVAEMLRIPAGVTQIALFPVAYTIGTDFSPASGRYPARSITFFDRYANTIEGDADGPLSMAQSPGVTIDIDIDASAAAVWKLVIDPNLPARFSEEFQAGHWGEIGDPGIGSTIIGTNEHPQIGTWETTSHVTEFEVEQRFAWAVSDPENPGARWRFELDSRGGSSTRLRYELHLGPGPSGLTAAVDANPEQASRIIAGRQREHRGNMERVLRGIKDLAESGS